jgi:hypothetical protein
MSVERRPDGTTRGGHEPPDEVQDTPEQNAGYDAAVRGEQVATPVDEGEDAPERDAHEGDRGKTSLTERPAAQPGRRSAGR